MSQSLKRNGYETKVQFKTLGKHVDFKSLHQCYAIFEGFF